MIIVSCKKGTTRYRSKMTSRKYCVTDLMQLVCMLAILLVAVADMGESFEQIIVAAAAAAILCVQRSFSPCVSSND